jgi:hypothetical protein
MGQRQSVVLAAALTAPEAGCGSSFTAAGPFKAGSALSCFGVPVKLAGY